MENLAALKSLIAKTIQRTDLSGVIPEWIAMCEAQIGNKLRTAETDRYFEVTTSNGQASMPEGLRAVLNLQVKDSPTRILPASRTEFDGLPPRAGLPSRYCVQGNYILLYPNPDTVVLQGRGHFSPSPLVNETDTNEILTRYPELYLYGSLKHSAPYLIEDNRLPVWTSLFETALRDANKAARKLSSPTSPAIRPNHRVNVGYTR